MLGQSDLNSGAQTSKMNWCTSRAAGPDCHARPSIALQEVVLLHSDWSIALLAIALARGESPTVRNGNAAGKCDDGKNSPAKCEASFLHCSHI